MLYMYVIIILFCYFKYMAELFTASKFSKCFSFIIQFFLLIAILIASDIAHIGLLLPIVGNILADWITRLLLYGAYIRKLLLSLH